MFSPSVVWRTKISARYATCGWGAIGRDYQNITVGGKGGDSGDRESDLCLTGGSGRRESQEVWDVRVGLGGVRR